MILYGLLERVRIGNVDRILRPWFPTVVSLVFRACFEKSTLFMLGLEGTYVKANQKKTILRSDAMVGLQRSWPKCAYLFI